MSDSVQPHRRQPTRLLCPWDSPGRNTGVGCQFLLQGMHACILSRFSCVQLCQGTLKSLLQQHSSKASILQCSVFFIVQLSHPYMTTGKTIVLTRQTFVDKVMSLLFHMLSRLVITFLPRSKHLSWLQSPSAAILEPPKIVCHCFRHGKCTEGVRLPSPPPYLALGVSPSRPTLEIL